MAQQRLKAAVDFSQNIGKVQKLVLGQGDVGSMAKSSAKGQPCYGGAQWENKRWCEIGKDLTLYKGKKTPYESDQTLEQTLQRGCAGSIFAGFQELSRESPEEPSLMPELALLWAGDWTADLLRFLPR